MKHSDIQAITSIHCRAFGPKEGAEIAQLAVRFLALPNTLSVSVTRGSVLAGNVLFTPFVFVEHPKVRCYLLAPNGVLPEFQGHGVGRELMEQGIAAVQATGAAAVFVLGVPGFYPRYGFTPTDKQTPFPQLLTTPEAWMVRELHPGAVQALGGATRAVTPFMVPELWDTSGRG
ncbi:GNAT family N-acetyltransferase [Shimia sediminis]|uniref:GNAT family N-acetyltransferase n=1 Tax=Shimia sediminis TaxID=2497945 RepID=UPI000F8C6AEF|nr:GNAT family N-acetyltransferase [Shimia sediminis]